MYVEGPNPPIQEIHNLAMICVQSVINEPHFEPTFAYESPISPTRVCYLFFHVGQTKGPQ